MADQDKWKMSFIMPSKYGSDLPLPKDPLVTIKEVPKKVVAVIAFSGFPSIKSFFILSRCKLKFVHESNKKYFAAVQN